MNCDNCMDGHYKTDKATCEACKRMQAEGDWEWYIDVGSRHIRCPYCGHGLLIGAYKYNNPHRFCSHCGKQMIKGEQIDFFSEFQ